MSAIGSLIFCTDCGNLLDTITGDSTTLDCKQCGHEYPASQFENLTVVTRSAENAFPSTLKSKRSVVKTSIKHDDMEDGATIKEKCPQCGHDEMQYHTLQLRSADEGATVFYTCKKCSYRFRTNN